MMRQRSSGAHIGSGGCWAQPDPLLNPASAAEAAHTGARSAAQPRPLTFTFVPFMRLTWPFLSRWRFDRVYETWSAFE